MTIRIAASLILVACCLTGCSEGHEPVKSPEVAAPKTDSSPIPITSAERIARDGVNNLFRADRFYFAGQPDESALVTLLEEDGVRTVINIRTPEETSGMSMDERGVTEEHGARYESIPISGSTFSRDDVDRFAEVIAASQGPVLVHCASSNRVGGLWAAYLATHHDVPLEEAIELGRSAGLSRDSMADAARRVASENTPSDGG